MSSFFALVYKSRPTILDSPGCGVNLARLRAAGNLQRALRQLA